MNTKMIRLLPLMMTMLWLLPSHVSAQKEDLPSAISGKWRVIWFSDDGVEQNMEAKKQQLVMRRDGTGTMSMLGEKVGDVTWVQAGKKKINFFDVKDAPPYLVKVTKSKDGKNMLFTGKMPNGVVRKVYFEALASRE